MPESKTTETAREQLENNEDELLRPYAIKSRSAIRLYHDNYKQCDYRTEFQRDKDRIVYSLAFKRLMEKTQVYLTNQGDHYTNRLSHTLEVAQISRTIAASLGLNQTLVEAIALGHDLGHTPFGHAVEKFLNKELKIQDGFEHNYQSVLLVDLLENKDFKEESGIEEAPFGLNLTNYTRYGILHHTKCKPGIFAYNKGSDAIATGDSEYKSLESELVNKVDTLTYLYHDLEDAIKNKTIFQEMKLNDPKQFLGFLEQLNLYTEKSCKIIGKTYPKIKDLWTDFSPNIILKAMIKDLIIGSQNNIKKYSIETHSQILGIKNSIINYNDFKEFEFKDFITEYIYKSPITVQMDTKATLIAEKMYSSFIKTPDQLPYNTRKKYYDIKDGIFETVKNRKDGGYKLTPERVICNYIAGMTDRYALEIYKRMFEA